MTTEILNNGAKNELFLSRNRFNQLTEHDYNHFLSAIQTQPRFSILSADIAIYLNTASQKPTILLKAKGNNFTKRVPVPEPVIISDSVNKSILFQLLILHKTLKDVRNTMNHASVESNYELKAIVLALKYYMIWLEQLNPNK